MLHRLLLLSLVTAVSLFAPITTPAYQVTISSVEGRVYGPDRRPVDRVVIKIYDEAGIREIGRFQTDTAGRFRFSVPAGRYVIAADPVAEPTLAAQRQELEILDAPGRSAGQRIHVTIILKPAALKAAAGPRFEQQVPGAAKAEYDRALKLIGTNREEGLAALRKAIELFADYYDPRVARHRVRA